jgi:hypothetical protein
MVPIVNPHMEREFLREDLEVPVFTRSPMVLDSMGWSCVTPVLTPLDLSAGSKDIARNNELRFSQDLQFAFHVKQDGMIVVKLGNNDPVKLGELIKQHSKSNVEIVVEIPMVDPKSLNAAHRSDVAEDFEGQDQWAVWHKLHEATNFSTKVRLVSDKISKVFEVHLHLFIC